MKNKQLGAIALLAGIAIGSGMISLPIVLANFGILGSLALMTFFCWVSYVSGMMRCELNLHSQADFSLKDVGLRYGGRFAAIVGDISLKTLSFALLSAYIFGGASLLHSFLSTSLSFTVLALIFTATLALMFLLIPAFLIKINQHLFITMFLLIVVGIAGLTLCCDTHALPLWAKGVGHWRPWSTVIPILFTSFGFQGSLHSLTTFVDNDRTLINRACLWGGIIPVVVYSLWVVCVLTIIFNSDPESFQKMLIRPIEVSELIRILSAITKISFLQQAVWIVSFLAILTSIMGVGLSLKEVLTKDLERLQERAKSSKLNLKAFCSLSKRQTSIISILIMILPSALVALLVPNAFIRILNFAGIILALLAIILPVFLFKRMKKSQPLRESFGQSLARNVVFVTGVLIIMLGIFEILS
ncbi:amino acid permease [Alphaproteobacteria bacterium]|nr:amino acid permease [Alphaproteobacteria bacterium]